jgi:hypothetical protein
VGVALSSLISPPINDSDRLKWGTFVQNVLEIHRATGYSASMRDSARMADMLEKDFSLRKRFENLKGVWGGAF